MRYIFIINPKTHALEKFDEIKTNLERIFSDKKDEYKIVMSKYVGHITKLAKDEAETGDEIRIFGIGGDGTLNEIVQGVVGFANVEIGVFPLGSGNDYVKTFGEIELFLDYDKNIFGDSIEVDVIKTLDSSAINICSVGFDAGVGYRMTSYKDLPFVSGPMSYDIAVARSLMGRLGAKLKVKLYTKDEVVTFTDSYLFVLAASGQYYGGGYHGAPRAIPNDGLLDFILVKTPSLAVILKLVGLYKKGEHLENKLFDKYLTFLRGYKIEIEGQQDFFSNCDGECRKTKAEEFSISEHKIKFILPIGVSL